MIKKILINLFIMLFTSYVYADELFLCQSSNGEYHLNWNNPSDNISQNQCEKKTVTSTQKEEKWLSILPKDESNKFFIIYGINKRNTFVPSRIITGNEANTDYFSYNEYIQNIEPVSNNILMAPTLTFGAEERAVITNSKDGTINFNCHVGQKPAGVLFDLTKLNLSNKQDYFLHITAQLNSNISFAFLDKGNDFPIKKASILSQQESSNLLHKNIKIDISTLNKMKDPQLAFLCPNNELIFNIKSLYLAPSMSNTNKSTYSSWIWSSQYWINSPRKFINNVKEKGINKLYIQLQIDNKQIKNKNELNSLLDIASQKNIQIFAVEGDPNMVTLLGRKNALERNKIIRDFCLTRKNKSCFSGIQYDIEPYILPEYGHKQFELWQQWTETIKALTLSWGSNIEIAVPFWLLHIKNGESIAQSVSPYVSAYNIMAYRTSNTSIYNISTPWLNWGEKNSQKIIIALENGHLDDEIQQIYRQTKSSGELEKVSFSKVDAFILNNKKITGENNIYAFEKKSVIKGDYISFMGQEDKMFSEAKSLSNIFSQWQSFNGFALHGVYE